MTIGSQFRRLCQVQIQRLLLATGIIVAVVVLFQLNTFKRRSILPNGSYISDSLELPSSHKIHWLGSSSNASYLNGEDRYKIEVEGEEKDYGFISDDDVDEMENFVEIETDKKTSHFMKERDLILNKSSTMRHVRSSTNGSVNEKVMQLKPFVTEQVNKSDQTSSKQNEHKPRAISRKWKFRNETSVRTQHKKSEHNVSVILEDMSLTAPNPLRNKSWKRPTTLSGMTALWLQTSDFTSNSMRLHKSSARDRELQHASVRIQNAPVIRNSLELHASVFRNVSMFTRSYDLMEHMLKIYVYKEGEKPIFHKPKMRGIYASEGWFMNLMEKDKQYVVKDPRKAHLFYLPFSSQKLRIYLHEQNYTSQRGELYLKEYVDMIAKKYRFWNRTSGADHFLVACHDWALKFTRNSMGSCIRALCNSNLARGFRIGKDVSLAVTMVRTSQNPLKDLGGNPPSERPFLAFFAGGMHGYLRPILIQYWNNKESDLIISGPMPRDIDGKSRYRELMKSSKYCICARGYEVHTPRLVESIFYECVPVIISDNYVPPFLEVLDWEAFSVFILEEDIPNLRNILLSIPEEKYLQMQHRVKMVQQHFLWHKKPVKYDLFHMTLHSIWYNRVFQLKST